MTGSRLGLVGVCGVVVVAMMAMFASSAQAGMSWLVFNAEETVATEVKLEGGKVNLLASVGGEIDSSTITLLTRLLALSVAVSCTSFATAGFNLEPEGKISAGAKFILGGCTVNQAGCTVKTAGSATGTVETEKLKGILVMHEIGGGLKIPLIKIEAEVAGGALAAIRFEGAECLLPLSNKLTGTLFLEDCETTTEPFPRYLIVQGPLTSLSVGADTVEHLETSLDGSGWLKLTGVHAGLKWAAMETP
jgi:hypothetical protein